MLNTNKYIKTAKFFLAVLIFTNHGISQTNLVSNPSFESFNNCSSTGCNDWFSSINTNFKNYGYFNINCSQKTSSVPLNNATKSNRYPHNGNGYSGVITYEKNNLRNYIQALLRDTLIKNKNYYIEFFIAYGTAYLYGANNLGLLIADTPIVTNFKPLPVAAQILPYGNPIIKDTINWIKVSGIYQAHGGEKYITLGNFSDNAHTLIEKVTIPMIPYYDGAGYFIDDVSVIPLDSMFLQADAGRDTNIYKGDSVFIGSRICGLTNVQWVDSLGNIIATNVPGLWVKPNTPSYYIITQNVGGQYSTDTVHIGVMQKLPVKLVRFSASIFTPSGDGGREQVAVLWETATEINSSHFILERSSNGKDFSKIATIKTKGAGVYEYVDTAVPLSFGEGLGVRFYRLKMVDKDGSFTYSKIVSVSLTTNNSPQITFSPNPAKESTTVSIHLSKAQTIQYQLINAEGKQCSVQKQAVPAGNSSFQISLKGLGKGIYWLKIEGVGEKQLVVE